MLCGCVPSSSDQFWYFSYDNNAMKTQNMNNCHTCLGTGVQGGALAAVLMHCLNLSFQSFNSRTKGEINRVRGEEGNTRSIAIQYRKPAAIETCYLIAVTVLGKDSFGVVNSLEARLVDATKGTLTECVGRTRCKAKL